MKMSLNRCIVALLLIVGMTVCGRTPASGKSLARIRAERLVSMNNLKQIGIASYSYACDFKDSLPPDFDTLVKWCYLEDTRVYISPADPVRRPEVKGEMRAENSSYVYVGKGLSLNVADSVKDLPLAFERAEIVSETGYCCVLYLGGRVNAVKLTAKSNREIAEELIRMERLDRYTTEQLVDSRNLVLANAAAADAKAAKSPAR